MAVQQATRRVFKQKGAKIRGCLRSTDVRKRVFKEY